ncbi:receptor-type tyrosine-protein phosphatase V isoform X1 [Oryzias melastigma]|uniref:receptor-type tyrosine-protein phosphatase V isoform X1 n=1 Tax=Oryzias melastigma TaxID=30732 RepID=UPI00168D4BEB|nr:receptor-type tyrosine-protein phosphatase V isoform X1 [Oryzias melastigma]
MRMETFSRSEILQELKSRTVSLAANNNRGFKQEFRELSEVGKDLPTKAGTTEANKEKNRYPFILPYDHSRVRLSVLNQDPVSDYINANFVPGGGSERDFICTQGPLQNTLPDFWRMVWEQNVRIIVMVTSLKQKHTIMCEKYWPLESGTMYCGSIQVTTVTRKQVTDFFVTTINLQQRGNPNDRIITHYYYPTWPDQGVPDPSSLCMFTEHVRQHLEVIPRLGPAVVHCSAGVGRSGTFVTLLWLMQLCMRGIQPNIKAAVEDLRLHRMYMVQTPDQYILIYHCLLHWLSGGAIGSRSQSQGAKLNANQQAKVSSSGRGDKAGRRRRSSQQQTPPTPQSENSVQQILKPGNLLRRLLPSLSNVKTSNSS